MANRKKEVYKPKPMTEGKRNIIQGLGVPKIMYNFWIALKYDII